jgi:hypothetical protein
VPTIGFDFTKRGETELPQEKPLPKKGDDAGLVSLLGKSTTNIKT